MLGFIQKYLTIGLAALLVLAVGFAGLQTLRLSWAQDKYDKHLLEDSQATEKAIAQAKALGERVTIAVNDAAIQYEKGKSDAKQIQTTVASQLNTGTVRVRSTWKCPAVVRDLPKDTPNSSEPSDAERERNESASRVIGAAHECDAQVASLIKLYNDTRVLINGK